MGARGVISRRQVLAATAAITAAAPALARKSVISWRDLVLTNAEDGRRVNIRVAAPARSDRGRAFIALSHGANGSFEGLTPLMTALAQTHVVAAPLHPDAESHPEHGKLPPREVWRRRLADMTLLLDQGASVHPAITLSTPIVALGHSYGALVAQAFGGATVFGERKREVRIRSVVAISPPGPLPGFIDAKGWATIEAPMLVTTGDADVLPVIAPTWSAHLASFEASSTRDSAAWVGRGVDHYFGRNIQRLTREAPDQSAQFAAMLDIVRQFVAATAERDARAGRWLAAQGPRQKYRSETLDFRWRASGAP